jgi:hypothetical protein
MNKIFAILLSFMFVCVSARAQNLAAEDVEAAFLYHFINYTDWNDDQTEYYICIPDDVPLRRAAQNSLRDKVVNNRKVVVSERWEGCHILVANSIPANDTILTVGPLAQGALLEFRVVNNKVKFAANLKKIKESKLKISSQLLKLAILEPG